jgi:hypothetical protein
MSYFRFGSRLASVVLAAALTCACAEAEPEPPATPPPPPPAPTAEPASTPEPYTQGPPGTPQAPPAPPAPPAGAAGAQPDADGAPLVYSYPTGQWVYASGHGWMWVPSGTTTTEAEDGVPYVYLYTPAYGWTWYVSPWGPGVYHYGLWVRHPWHPVGWHGYWVAHPGVVGHLRGRR